MSQKSRSLPLSKQILFSSILILAAIALAELLLRFVDREAILVRGDDPQMVYSFYPGRSGVALGPEYRASVAIDRQGLRYCPDQESISSGAVAARSTFLIGDSFAEGWGVECERSYAGILAGESGAGVQVLNLGIHGGTISYYILRQRPYLERYRPDRVVLQIFDNDLDDLDKFAPFATLDESGQIDAARPASLALLPPGLLSRTLRESMLFRLARRVASIARHGQPLPIKYYRPSRVPDQETLSHAEALAEFGELQPLAAPESDYQGQFAFYQYSDPARLPPLWVSRFERFELYLGQFHSELTAHNRHAELVLLYIPAKELFAEGGILGDLRSESGQPRRATSEELRATIFYRLLADYAMRHDGVVLLDTLSVLGEDAESLYFPGDAHLNEAGHAKIAELLLNSQLP